MAGPLDEGCVGRSGAVDEGFTGAGVAAGFDGAVFVGGGAESLAGLASCDVGAAGSAAGVSDAGAAESGLDSVAAGPRWDSDASERSGTSVTGMLRV